MNQLEQVDCGNGEFPSSLICVIGHFATSRTCDVRDVTAWLTLSSRIGCAAASVLVACSRQISRKWTRNRSDSLTARRQAAPPQHGGSPGFQRAKLSTSAHRLEIAAKFLSPLSSALDDSS